MAAVAAIDAEKHRRFSASVIYRNDAFLDSFQYSPGISLELLENAAFPFASRRALSISIKSHHQGLYRFHDRLFLQRFKRPRCP
jgi:hypothetical protein